MKTKQILIKGRKVRCRALKLGEKRRRGDFIADGMLGTLAPWEGGYFTNQEEGADPAYRPIKSKPRTAKAVKREDWRKIAHGLVLALNACDWCYPRVQKAKVHAQIDSAVEAYYNKAGAISYRKKK